MISRPALYNFSISMYWLSKDNREVDKESTYIGLGYSKEQKLQEIYWNK